MITFYSIYEGIVYHYAKKEHNFTVLGRVTSVESNMTG